jgi:hypothetical protein
MSESSIINIRKLFTGGEKLKIARKKIYLQFFSNKKKSFLRLKIQEQ